MSSITISMTIAFVGWLASSYALKRTSLFGRWQRALIVPLWFVWMAVALGGPVANGSLAFADAIRAGAACMAGMSSYLFASALGKWKRR